MYKCEKCGFEASSQWHLDRHLNKKKPCVKINKDSENIDKNRWYCVCGKNYSSRQHLHKHKTGCQKYIDYKEYERTTPNAITAAQYIHNLSGNNNNINYNQITINVIAHDKTNISELLTDEEIIKLLKSKPLKNQNNIITAIVDKVHFNPECPENKNIFISNIRNDDVLIYDGEEWKLHDRKEAINNLYSNKRDYIETKLCDWADADLYPEARDKLNNYLEGIDNTEGGETKVKKDITLLLYNNRKQIDKKKKTVVKTIDLPIDTTIESNVEKKYLNFGVKLEIEKIKKIMIKHIMKS